jgi:hypothetical protein
VFKYSNNVRNIFLIAVFFALAFPAAISAQPVPTHKFAGTVTIDGVGENWLTITAFIDGSRVASTKTIRGRYTLSVEQTSRTRFAGKIISFKVSGNPVESTAIWKAGGSSKLDFSVETGRQLTPRPKIKPSLTPTLRPKVKPSLTPTLRPEIKPTLTPTLRPKVGPTLSPTLRPKSAPEAEKKCSDIKEVFGAPDDNGTIVMTLERLPVLQGDVISLTGTTNYDGNQIVLREYYYDGSWEYLIKHRWEGVSPRLKGDPAKACSGSTPTPIRKSGSTPTPIRKIERTPETSPESLSKPAQKRGFLVNSPVGGIASDVQWNGLDAQSLSIIGIILTLITAAIPLFKGD